MSSHTSFKQIFTIRNLPVYYLVKLEQTKILSSYLIDSGFKVIAIDQERAPYNKYYYQRPCLLQISTEKDIFLIDLLVKNDILFPLIEIFYSKKILKVFFDASWDLFYFKDYYQIDINNIFDIQIATSLIYPKKGTLKLEELIDIHLEKIDSFKSKNIQKSDWSIRPLTKQQFEYASSEISYFLPIYKELNDELIKLDLLPFLIYGNEQLKEKLPTNIYDPFSVIKIKGFNDLSNEKKQLVYNLGIAREMIAQKRNRPSFYILTNKQMINLSFKPLNKVITQNQKFTRNERKIIETALKKEVSNELFDKSINNMKFSDLPLIQQKLFIWRNNVSKEFHIPKRLILSKENILSLKNEEKESVINRMWFSNKKHKVLEKLSQNLKENL